MKSSFEGFDDLLIQDYSCYKILANEWIMRICVKLLYQVFQAIIICLNSLNIFSDGTIDLKEKMIMRKEAEYSKNLLMISIISDSYQKRSIDSLGISLEKYKKLLHHNKIKIPLTSGIFLHLFAFYACLHRVFWYDQYDDDHVVDDVIG